MNNVDQRGFTKDELDSMLNWIYQCDANIRVKKDLPFTQTIIYL